MITGVKLLFLLFFVSSAVNLFANELNIKYKEEIKKGLEFTLEQKYDSAQAQFHSIIKQDPDYPAGYLFLINSSVAKFYDKNDTSSLKNIFSIIDSVLKMTRGKKNSEQLFYRASALGYKSILNIKQGEWIKGSYSAYTASNIFETLINRGSSSGDIRGMKGSYNYWSSVLFSKIPFVSDKRKNGVDELNEGLKSALYMKYDLLNSLLCIYYDNREYSKALSICQSVLLDYPKNRIFRIFKMNILHRMGEYNSALKLSDSLLIEYKELEEANVNLTSIAIKKSEILSSIGRKDEAIKLSDSLQSINMSSYMKMRLKRAFTVLKESQ